MKQTRTKKIRKKISKIAGYQINIENQWLSEYNLIKDKLEISIYDGNRKY